ncbi:P-loop containing nucleoside triphosphate hydrolase protein [Coniella lustricola]|uniref:P-loop containing nucleoside triphosphate hydrolase protein n=1 Tax=Coniella lustricola TaxID=2025994 RepID=A0A2T3A8V2_9PEZI|nr:P-loop containing nucleoside triphosphate hydrolase protein [Coniella lustricola]
MPSSTTSTEHTSASNEIMDGKRPYAAGLSGQPSLGRKSLFRRATSKLRAAVCLPETRTSEPTSTSPSSPLPEAAAISETENSVEAAKKDVDVQDGDKDDKSVKNQTMKCEFKHLDRKLDSEDKPYFLERKKDDIERDQKDWWQLFSFCVVRRYDSDGDLSETCLYVNPQPLRQLLRDVIGDYPSDPIDVDDVQICAPYHSLFHYRKQLEKVGLERFSGPSEAQSNEHLRLLLDWIKTTFELEIAAYEKCLANDFKAITYDKLWTLFKPDTIVHTQLQGHHRAFRVLDYFYSSDDDEEQGFHIQARYVDYDGERFGERRSELVIDKYTGAKDIGSHNVRPFEFIDDVDAIREILLKRGKRFEELAAGQHFMQYKGIGFKRDPQCPSSFLRYDATGRVMIDCKTYHRIDANDNIYVHQFGKLRSAKGLTEEDMILANCRVRGYSLTAKRFMELSLDSLSPIEWNSQCFQDLVLDSTTKKTVQALVSTHSQKKSGSSEAGFDDIVKGKGLGLVCVLHGPPGVGKTLTAECVAEYVQRPLFMVSSGDLGTDSESLDKHLTEIMDMTSTWRAVLLIDEADVFLEQRALHDLHRNAMVSVFLRVLEYYSGILFLTTNRVATFDDAFKSRIHIPIRYTDLDFDSRLKIWRNFCSKISGGVNITESEYNKLADHELNGRQIKNVIKAAESLAAFDQAKLDFKQLEQVTKIQATFEKDLESFGEIDYTAPGAARRHAESKNLYF